MADPDSSTAESDESPASPDDATDGATLAADGGTASEDEPTGARMMLEPDAVHEETGEPSIDCPQCGATVGLVHIIEEGRCTGYLEDEDAEVEGDGERLQESGCTAKLSLELVWEA